MTTREEKVKELLRELSAKYLNRAMPAMKLGSASDTPQTPLVTVTRTDVSSDFKHSTIYISVLPDKQEERVLRFIETRLGDLREFVSENLSMRALPYFKVEIDKGEKKRRRIDQLSKFT